MKLSSTEAVFVADSVLCCRGHLNSLEGCITWGKLHKQMLVGHLLSCIPGKSGGEERLPNCK